MAPNTEAHGAIQAELAALIGNHLLAAGDPSRVIIGPGIVPRVRAAENVRIADLGVTRAAPGRDHLLPAPMLVIEILSPSNAEETWENVWAYTTIPSVTEILVISSTAVEAELLRREPDGSWPAQADPLSRGDTLRLDSIALALPLTVPYRASGIG